jgi:hypothetical protein
MARQQRSAELLPIAVEPGGIRAAVAPNLRQDGQNPGFPAGSKT